MLGEVVGNVNGEYLSPQIAIVASCVAPTPHMVEVRGRVARRNLCVEQTDVVELLLLESSCHIGRRHLVGTDHVPCKVETCRGKILAKGVSCLEVDALEHACLEVGWHRLASLGVACEMVENLGYACKRLVKLRRKLYEVACYGCT